LQSQGTKQGTFFNTDNMQPLTNNPAAAAALDVYKQLSKLGPPDQLNDDVGNSRGLFITGRCALSLDWGDIGTLAIDPTQSRVADKVGAVILPGSKHVAADLAWLRASGIADELLASDTLLLGVCGGMQMLGERIDDRAGVDGDAEGLGLLPLRTVFHREKTTRPVEARFGAIEGPWRALSGALFRGYEIRHGATTGTAPAVLPDGLGFASGRVLALGAHGVFEQTDVLTRLFGTAGDGSLEQAFDELADAVERHLDLSAVLPLEVTA